MISKSKLKYIQSLSDKKHRDADGVFIAEGPRAVGELLTAGDIEALELFALDSWIPPRSISGGTTLYRISADWLDRLSSLQTPNEVLGLFRKPRRGSPVLQGRISLMVDGIQDPGNMGTLIRTADWFGIRQVICSADCADAFGPKAVQASMGSIGRVAVFTEDLPQILDAHPDIVAYAGTLEGLPLAEVSFNREAVLLVGSEGRGIRPELLRRARVRVTIPRLGGGESLNAAVAAGILLYAATAVAGAP